MQLAHLERGQSAVVTRVTGVGAFRRRLLELGLVPGTRITRTWRAGLGDPIAYEVRGVVLCLRHDEALTVEIEPPTERLAAK
ncbi:MAG: ferrous iron transport protein A [Deltaproteobacteria bacterium]|nr:MAG: ferrous iron transport protein A [Deltaproteobacteria bacterium]